MDRAVDAARPCEDGDFARLGDEHVLPSRAGAINRLRGMLAWEAGPLLLSGQPGAGKTWLLRRLVAAMPYPWRWAFLDVSPAVNVEEFLRLTREALGDDSDPYPRNDRARIGRILNERAADGERWVLAVDEVHTALQGVLEEIRVLSNRLGEPGRFHGLILCGQNSLARRMLGTELGPLNARVVGHVHLAPVTVEEFRDWMRAGAGESVSMGEVEWLHRQLAGNPRALRRALEQRRGTNPPRLSASPPVPARVEPTTRPAAWSPSLLTAPRPPIEESEGMIEVGWEPPDDAEAEHEHVVAEATIGRESVPRGVPALTPATGEEDVQDHYAALQAWTEWTRNEGHAPQNSLGPDAPRHQIEGEAERELDAEPTSAFKPPGVWAEPEQGFAPYGQLFTRLKRATDPK